MIGDKIERRRSVAHGSKESRDLAAMMGRVVDDVEQKHPHWLVPLLSL